MSKHDELEISSGIITGNKFACCNESFLNTYCKNGLKGKTFNYVRYDQIQNAFEKTDASQLYSNS